MATSLLLDFGVIHHYSSQQRQLAQITATDTVQNHVIFNDLAAARVLFDVQLSIFHSCLG